MKTEEIVDAARNAGFSSSEIMHRLAAFKRLINSAAYAEREKFTNTQEFVTLPREVVEQALEAMTAAMGAGPYKHRCSDAEEALREALEQPQGSRALTDISRDAQEAPFEAWWEKHGQFLRTGGGQYEKTFAWNAWCEAAKKSQPKGDQTEPAYLLRDLADDISVDALDLIAAIRDAGLGSYSINMMLPAKVCVAMCQKFEQPQVEQEICCKIWSVNRIDDLGKIVDSSGRLIATVYGSQADKIVACHNSYTQQRHKREPLENEQARRIYNSATYSASLAVFMTRIDAEHPDADDKGVSGWLQEAEDRVKHRTIDAAHEIGQAAAPQQGEQEPVGEVGSMPGTIGFTMACFHASDAPVGTKLYTRPQNLRCKSTQARLATLWGYEKPQPKRGPLTDDQISRLWSDAHNDTTDRMAFQVLARAIEASHNIK